MQRLRKERLTDYFLNFIRSAPKLSCIEEFEEEENEENVLDRSDAKSCLNGSAILARLSSPIEEEEEAEENEVAEEAEEVDVISRVPGSPSAERKSCPEAVIQAHLGTRQARPHTVPMDAKLNLPYLTGYDKVMHMLDMPCESLGGESRLLDEDEDEEYSYPYVATNSDPVASSPSSNASESVVDTGSEDDYSKQSQREDSGQEEDRDESDENEINDNVSDESGYSEEATHHHRNKETQNNEIISTKLGKSKASDETTKLSPGHKESPCAKNKRNAAAVTGNEDLKSPTNPTSPALVIYDNLCFEI